MPKFFKDIWGWIANLDALKSLWGWVPSLMTTFIATIWAKIDGFPPSMLLVLGIFIFACCLFISSFIIKAVKRFHSKADEKISNNTRMSLIELRDEAEKAGWIFYTRETLEPLDFTHGLKQAGLDGAIKFFGRQKEFSDQLTHNNPLIEIDKNYWDEYEVTSMLFHASDNFNVVTFAFFPTVEEIFKDIHVDKNKAMYWLNNEAGQYRGRRERYKDVHG